mgnify:CR=1 FL=1
MDWSEAKIRDFRAALLRWYDAEKRELPWRRDHDPYHVLVSELMLQQTQVNTVIPYYKNFLAQFPTVQALAAAAESDVMKAWEGLGYYSRARNLQKAAKQLCTDYAGQWPETAAGLVKLSGIGPYTAGAIASIAFNQPEPAIDGNAFRVFARLFCVADDIAKPQTRAVFDRIIRRVIDPERPGDFNQAIMDLGASYMSATNPDPAHSPVAAFDESYQTGRVLDFPVKTKKAKPVVIPYFAFAIHSDAGWLLEKRPQKGMLADLWMFKMAGRNDLPGATTAEQLVTANAQLTAALGVPVDATERGLREVKHTFTHQQWQITIVRAEIPAVPLTDTQRWVPDARLGEFALPTVQKKLLKALGIMM